MVSIPLTVLPYASALPFGAALEMVGYAPPGEVTYQIIFAAFALIGMIGSAWVVALLIDWLRHRHGG